MTKFRVRWEQQNAPFQSNKASNFSHWCNQPPLITNRVNKSSNFRIMVVISWLLTFLFSLPQAVIFRVLKHPEKDFYQCTTFAFWQNLGDEGKFTEIQLIYRIQLLCFPFYPLKICSRADSTFV